MTFRDIARFAVPFGLAIVLSACVLSVNPVVSDADSLHEPRLLGNWEEVSGSDRAVISLAAENRYAVEYASDNKVGKFEARLGRLGEHLVLDAWPVKAENVKEGPDAGLRIAGHLLFVADVGDNEISVTMLEPDSMLDSIRAGDVRTPYSDNKGQLILTGTTEELRSALGPYLSRPGALSKPSVWRRAKQRAPGPVTLF